MGAPQVSVSEVDALLRTLQFAVARYAACRPGPLLDAITRLLDEARTDEVFIADVAPIVEDTITVNAPYVNKLIALNIPLVQRFIAAIKRQQARSSHG
jgi:hypothetical protein